MHISYARVYKFKHLMFEWHSYMGPVFLRHADCEPKPEQLRPMRDYAVLNKWERLCKNEREQYRIY